MHFSIVTPVLNGAAWIEHAIHSLRAQTHPEWSQLIIDGGSTDATLEIVQRFASEDPRVRLIQLPRSNIYTAVVRGFDLARGDWFGWLNADDLYAPWALETAAKHVVASGCLWLSGLPGWWDDHGRLRAVRNRAWAPRALIQHGCFHDQFLGCLQQESILFSRELFTGLSAAERDQIAALDYAGDFLLWRLFAHRTTLSILPAVLGGFRVHDRNLSRRLVEKYHKEVVALGAPVPPAWLRRPLRGIFDLVSAHVTGREEDRAIARLISDIR